MDELIFNNGIIEYRSLSLPYIGSEKIDDMCVHVTIGEQTIALIGENTIINGILQKNADEIIAVLNNI